MPFWAKYGTETTFQFPMIKRDTVDFAVSADWTPASGDVAVSKDNGNLADATNSPAIEGGSPTRGAALWAWTATATELQCATLGVQVIDAATKAVEDQSFVIYTYGHASAFFKGDWSDIVRLGLTALPNAEAEAAGGLFTRGTGAGQINQAANGQIDTNLVAIEGSDATDQINAACDTALTDYGAAQPGDQMDLVNAPNNTALTAIGAKLEAMMLDEGDATALLAAIAAKVEEFLINEGDATATLAAIAAAVTTAIGDGSALTEAGGTGDHLTALATAANQTTILNRTGYVDNTVWFEKDASGGTTLHTHGIYETPVGSWADAKTLADQLSRKVKVKSRAGNPTLGITVGAVDLSYLDIDANGHQLSSLSSTTLTGATLRNGRTGSAMTLTQASKLIDFHSELGILTMSPSGTDVVMPCAINSDIFSVAIADAPSLWREPIRFIGCRTHWSTVAMAVDYTDPGLSSTRLSFENHIGDLNFTNFPDAEHNIVVTGHGTVTIAASCLGGTLYYGPGITVTNNGSMTATPIGVGAELAKVPKSDGSVAFNATAVSGIQSGLATAANQTTILDKLLGYFQLALRSDSFIETDRAVELAEINANEGSGGGSYSSMDSIEAIRDALSGVSGLSRADFVKFVQLICRSDAAVAADLAAELAEINANTGSGTGDYDPLATGGADSLEGLSDGSAGGGPSLNEILDGIQTRFGAAPYTKPAGVGLGTLVTGTSEAVDLTYKSTHPVTVEVVHPETGAAYQLPDPDVETMTLVFETLDGVDVYERTTDAGSDPWTVADDFESFTFTPTAALVSVAPRQLIFSIRGDNNRPIASGTARVKYYAYDDDE